MKIQNLKHHADGSWTFHINDKGCYYTNRLGDGLFYQEHSTGNCFQLLGTSQFSACKTASGMRRKLYRIIDET